MQKTGPKVHFNYKTVVLLLSFSWITISSFGQFNLPNVSAISTNKDKEAFLLALFQLDQRFRNEQAEIALSTDTVKIKENTKNWILADSICREQLAEYITLYGYPDGDSLSTLAKYAPMAVVLHAVPDLSHFLRHFEVLNQAYKDQNLSESDFDFYLCKVLCVIKQVSYVKSGGMTMERKIRKVKKIARPYVERL